MHGFGASLLSSSPFRSKHSTDSSPMYKRGAANAATGTYKENQQQASKQASKFQFQTLVFKVQVHCDACMRKVKKAIASIEGVESIAVDVNQKRITVTGHIDRQKLLKRVAKTGKQVELITGKDPSNGSNNTTSGVPINSNSNNNNTHSSAEKPLVLPMDSKTVIINTTPLFSLQTSTPPREDAAFVFQGDEPSGCSIM